MIVEVEFSQYKNILKHTEHMQDKQQVVGLSKGATESETMSTGVSKKSKSKKSSSIKCVTTILKLSSPVA